VPNSPARGKAAAPAAEQPSDTIAAQSALLTRCILFSRVSAGANGRGEVPGSEKSHAVQRCLKRMRRAAEAFGGRTFKPGADGVLALFPDADSTLQAACELHQRVADLPPSAGIHLTTATGLDFGSALVLDDQIYGEAVDRVNALVGVARADQILATGDVVSRLAAPFAALAHAQEAPDAGRTGALPALFGFVPSEIARTAGTSPAPSARMAQPRLILSLGNDRITVDGRRGVRTLGRDIGNDLSVGEPRASRTHARIELRGNAFVVVDVSRNGTFVQLDSGRQIVLRQEEMELPEQGQISLGRPCAPEAECVSFEILRD
jgi:class 3 adenylate cyclase